jgi:hypothetical protein
MFVKVLPISSVAIHRTYPKVVRLVKWEDNDNLVLLPESRDELRDIPATPICQPYSSVTVGGADLRLSRISISFSILAGLLVAKIRLRASLTL